MQSALGEMLKPADKTIPAGNHGEPAAASAEINARGNSRVPNEGSAVASSVVSPSLHH